MLHTRPQLRLRDGGETNYIKREEKMPREGKDER